MKKALAIIAYLFLAFVLTVFITGELRISALNGCLVFSKGVRVFGSLVVVGLLTLLTLKLVKGGKKDEPSEKTH